MTESLHQEPLSPVEAFWDTTPEVPLAYGHPDNPITHEDVENWLTASANFASYYPTNKVFREFMTPQGKLNTEALVQRYRTELCYLSKVDMLAALTTFGQEILDLFDPKRALFYLPPESGSAFLMRDTLIALYPELADFGQAVDSRSELRMRHQNAFFSEDVNKADAYIYVDDWVLTSDHIRTFLTWDVAGRFHTFHIAVSDRGWEYFKKVKQHLLPRFRYSVKSDNPKGSYPRVPVFGYHKIPDTVPDYYSYGRDGNVSIFGKRDGVVLRKNHRLVDHSGSLLDE